MPVITQQVQRLFPSADAIPPEVRVSCEPYEMRYLIDGQIRTWSGPAQDIYSPVCIEDGQGPKRHKLGRCALLTEKEAMEALDAACRAYGEGRGDWPTRSVADRIACLQAFIPRMQAMRDVVVKLLMWEIGKTLPDAEKEFDRTVEYIRATVDALKDVDRAAARFAIEQGIIGQVRRSPLGVVLCMGPFNYPLNETYTTLIPALIMGNTLIVKPPKYGTLLHLPLLEAFRDSFPKGVVNMIWGDGKTIITPIIRSGKINVLAFIGTSKVADLLRQQHPIPHRLRCVLGLEAKNPAVILPDADLEVAVRECVVGALSYNGQRCTALKLLFVHRSLADRFLKAFSDAIAKLPAGMPWEPGIQLTPLPEDGKPEYLKGLVDEAIAKGARIVNPGGGEVHATFYSPAVVYPVTSDMQLYHVEQFGPVIPIAPFDREEEVIDYVTKSNYGAQISLFGHDPIVLGRMIDALVNQVCRINLNAQCQRGPDTFPFTGRKDSAEGTLSVSDALRCFSIRSLVATKAAPGNEQLIRDIITGRRSRFLTTDFIF